jgi:hypothetical protein
MTRSILTDPSVTGSVTRWQADRKFGFAKTATYNRVFIHVSSLCPHFLEARSTAIEALAIDVFGRDLARPRGPIQQGMSVFLLVEPSEQGPRAWMTMCPLCDSHRDLLEKVHLYSERLDRIFANGYAFIYNHRRFFYSTRMAEGSKTPQSQIFEAAAIRAIQRGEPNERVVALAESAVRHFSDMDEQKTRPF